MTERKCLKNKCSFCRYYPNQISSFAFTRLHSSCATKGPVKCQIHCRPYRIFSEMQVEFSLGHLKFFLNDNFFNCSKTNLKTFHTLAQSENITLPTRFQDTRRKNLFDILHLNWDPLTRLLKSDDYDPPSSGDDPRDRRLWKPRESDVGQGIGRSVFGVWDQI